MIHEKKYPGKQAQVVANSMTLILLPHQFQELSPTYTFPTLKGGGSK